MVSTFYPPYHFGGDALYVQRLSQALADRGHEVEVIHCEDAFRVSGGRVREDGTDDAGITVHRLKSRWGRLSPVISQQTGRLGPKREAVRRILETGRFDVIHCHNISLMGGMEVLTLGKAVKLLSLHDYWLACPTHVMFRDNREACRQPACLKCQCLHRRPPQLWRNARRMRRQLASIDCVLSSSTFTSRLLAERGFELPTRYLPLFSGSMDASALARPGLPPRYFLFIGRLEKIKGLQDILPWFLDHPHQHLVIGGDGSWAPRLKALAGHAKNVHFLGQINAGELFPLYANALATLLPSLCYEIAPLVLGESWSAGTPVIARRIGALEEHVGDSGCGCLFSTMEEFGRLAGRLASDEEWRNRLAANSLAHLESSQGIENHLDGYLAIIGQFMRSDP